MNHKIQNIVQKISTDNEQREYFFNNLAKMKSPELWFTALNNANLLTPDNTLAIAYIRMLLMLKMQDDDFISVVSNWLDSFLLPDSQVPNVMSFIEEVISLNNLELNKKCKEILIDKLSNSNTLNQTINSIVYKTEINNFIFIDENLVLFILKIIIEFHNFSIISQDIHTVLTVREKLSKFLISHNKSNYLSIVLVQLSSYLDTEPIEFLTIDTIDSAYYSFSYGSYIIGFLINIIDASSTQENEDLIAQLVQCISKQETKYLKKTFSLKIIIYIISQTKKYELIVNVINHIQSLEELSSIKYAIYHCVIKKCTDNWYKINPGFNDWLSKLDYSEHYKSNCKDKIILNNWKKQTKLSLLYPFKMENSLYSDLINDYPYEVQEPEKSFEIKSSWQSTNNYLDVFKSSSIEDIVEFLNGTKEIQAKTDFPDIHLEEALKQDFNLDNEKYTNKIQYIFNGLNSSHHKSWILYKLSNLVRDKHDKHYIEILDSILSLQNVDKYYFDAILSLICSVADKHAAQLLPYETSLTNFFKKNFLSNNDTNNIDQLAGGRNSLSGQCLYILIQISIAKDETLLEFANNINNYKEFLKNPNGLLMLGHYLFWLFAHKAFLEYFNVLDRKAQNLIFSTYFKYINYVHEEIFKQSIKNKFIDTEENIHPYINHAMYFYLTNENNYLFELLNNQLSNEKIIEAIVSSLNTYRDQIIRLKAKNKLIEIWEKILTSPICQKIASRILYNSTIIDTLNERERNLFSKTVSLLTLHSIIYENEIVKLLYKLINEKQFGFVMNILLNIANNSLRTYYTSIEYLDEILIILSKQSFKLLDSNREKFIILIARLIEINYPVTIKVKK